MRDVFSDYVRDIMKCSVDFSDHSYLENVANVFQDRKTDYSETFSRYCSSPFPHGIIDNFLSDAADVDCLESILRESVKFNKKNNDLHKFSQSAELADVAEEFSSLKSFLVLLKESMMPWIKEISGADLADKEVSMNASRYDYTDILLCHDDELERRRIAYVFYLVPHKWDEKDGGLLNLRNCNPGDLQPAGIAKSYVPKRNTFVFFDVTERSHHEVTEILRVSGERYSLHGWFYGVPLKRSGHLLEPLPPRFPAIPSDDIEELLELWVNPSYLSLQSQGDIQSSFEENSEIQLEKFLLPEKYADLQLQLASTCKDDFTITGPANSRMYYLLKDGREPPILREFLSLLRSEAFFLLLSNLSGLRFHALAPVDSSDSETDACTAVKRGRLEQTASCCVEIKEWRHGCYTLLHDACADLASFALDVFFWILPPEIETGSVDGHSEDTSIPSDAGGYVCYVAKGEDKELLTVVPKSNSLALVYRDKETLAFTKHVNNKFLEICPRSQRFHQVASIFYE